MSSPEKIVFTGLGAVCSAGKSVEDIWDAINGGCSAVAPISHWDASRWPVGVAAECAVDGRTLIPDRKLHKTISRTDMFGIYAADQAVQQSGLLTYREKLDAPATVRFNDRSGILSGSGGGTYQSCYEFLPLLHAANGDIQQFGRGLGDTVNPMWLLKNLPNNVLCHAGIRFNFKGVNTCVTNQCTSGVLAVAESAAALRAGEADRMVAVGHDTPLEPETVFHFHRLGLLATDALRPFDCARNGTVFGEGAAAVVLETADGARARGATVLGELLGAGCVSEATGILDLRSDGDGVSRAIDLALAEAGVACGQVGMIIAHGNGTRVSDASEVAGIRKVFGDNLPPMTAFKWAYGHLFAASGIIDLVFGLTASRHRVVPGIHTLKSPDPELAPLPVSSTHQSPRSDIALTVCRGFGGMNVALVIRAAPGASTG